MPLVSSSTPSSRPAARALIVQRANIFKVNAHRRRWRWNAGVMTRPTLLSMRQLQLAVCICRRNNLVTAETLAAAGFRTRRSVPAPTLAAAAA